METRRVAPTFETDESFSNNPRYDTLVLPRASRIVCSNKNANLDETKGVNKCEKSPGFLYVLWATFEICNSSLGGGGFHEGSAVMLPSDASGKGGYGSGIISNSLSSFVESASIVKFCSADLLALFDND